ncbi:MAG: HAMP domain-containing sensor histidine kinase [Pseudomonadota bacterium]
MIGRMFSEWSIKKLIVSATVAVSLLFVLSVAFSLWVFANAQSQLSRAFFSYEQLSIATGLETDAARALISEAQRRQEFAVPAGLAVDENKVDSTLDSLIERIRDEIGSLEDAQEQAAEAEEFVAAFAIRESYGRLERALADRSEGEPALDQEALGHFLELDSQLAEVIADERMEVADSLDELVQFRRELRRYSFTATLAAVLAVIAAAVFSYRGLMRPVRALDAGSNELASGNIAYRIATSGPRELGRISERINEMASRLEEQQQALKESNERLETTVAERTAQLAEKASTLQAIDESRRLFFAKVGHELRTPLTVLLGESEVALASKSGDPARYREALEHIGAHGEHMKRRISDLLALARSLDGRIRITPHEHDLLTTVQNTIDATKSYARSHDVLLSLNTRVSRLPALVDGGWLEQALMALVDNAIKFSPADTTIVVSLHQEEGEIAITVADQGPGVSDDELPMLTQPFFQGENVSARAGTGLGLAVAHWVMEQHGGRLDAGNLPGGGFKVSLLLPSSVLVGVGTH